MVRSVQLVLPESGHIVPVPILEFLKIQIHSDASIFFLRTQTNTHTVL
jgi:hypothetical protein